MVVQPIDLVALLQVFFTGVAAVLGGLAAVFGVLAAARAKRAEDSAVAIKENIALIERNTNSMTTEIARLSRKEGIDEGERKGERAGQESARQLAEGIRQGIATERSSVAASNQGETKLQQEKQPVPVADDRTAVATERIADATEKKVK